MALFTANVVKENRATVSKTLLLNTCRVSNYYVDSEDDKVVFFYEGLIRRQGQVAEYKFDGTMDQFRVKVIENDLNNDLQAWIHMYVLTVNNITRNTDYEVQTSKIILAQDVTNTTYDNFCEMWIQHGGFEMVKFELPFSISELDASASVSGSMSRIGLPTYSDGSVY